MDEHPCSDTFTGTTLVARELGPSQRADRPAEHGADCGDGRIFVQVAAYRDPELLPTLRDCIARAAQPDLLTFGLMWQHDDGDSLAEFTDDPRVRVISCHFSESLGVCWARRQLQQLYAGEQYTLSLDSHHRFVDSWDRELRTQFAALAHPKAVLTTYLPPYEPGAGLHDRADAVILAADYFDRGGALLFQPYTVDDGTVLAEPQRARFYSAHFAFSRGEFITDCPHDPQLYFLGEEISIAVRAFTHGYDLYHPSRNVAFHRYSSEDRPRHWHDHGADVGERRGAWRLDLHSKRRMRVLLGMEPGEIEWGTFGLGQQRTLSDYEDFAGVDFAARHISDEARQGRAPARR